jgi:hypothetical protein
VALLISIRFRAPSGTNLIKQVSTYGFNLAIRLSPTSAQNFHQEHPAIDDGKDEGGHYPPRYPIWPGALMEKQRYSSNDERDGLGLANRYPITDSRSRRRDSR